MTEINEGGVQGILHLPAAARMTGVVLTHGAGADCRSALLSGVSEQLAAVGYHVLRCNLAFRQRRRAGPPHPSQAKLDQESLAQAVAWLRKLTPERIILGGHSYGGRQATMLAADQASIAAQLLLLSYPLHPPAKPEQKRVAHFPALHVNSIFVIGTADPFGSPSEMQEAIKAIPAPTHLFGVSGAGHDLKRGKFDLLALIGGALSI